MLISKTHSTEKTYLYKHKSFSTNHPDGKAHGGTAVIIKKCIKCIELDGFKKDYIQATTIYTSDIYLQFIARLNLIIQKTNTSIS